MHDPDDITCWQRLDKRTTTSGCLQTQDIDRLNAIGVRHVINLAVDDHALALAEEDHLMAKAGIRYTHIPVPFDNPNEDQFDAFRKAYEAVDGPVHAHCIANWRVSAFFYRYNRDIKGMNERDARALMERHWTPETSNNPSAPLWARFVAPKGETLM